MGNHDAGRAMGRTATAILKREKGFTKEKALAALDEICEPYRGSDAEFEAAEDKDYFDYTDPSGPLGHLIAVAFSDRSPKDWAKAFIKDGEVNEETSDEWSFGPMDKFRLRYDIY